MTRFSIRTLRGVLALLLASTPVLAAALPAATLPVPTALSAPLAVPLAEPAPRPEQTLNPALTLADRTLNEDTVWRGEVLVEGVVTVAPQATLSIEPGTVIRFRRKGSSLPILLVQGRIVAQGTADLPVLFSSSFALPAPGDWQGVLLLASEKKNSFEHCRIEGAATALESLFSTVTLKGVRAEKSLTGMRFQDSVLAMEGGGAFHCDAALKLSESEANLIGVAASDNAHGIQVQHSSLYLSRANISGNAGAALVAEASRIKVQGGFFKENGSGITLSSSEGSVTGATLSKNQHFGISLAKSRVRVSGNEITANREPGLMVEDGAAVAFGNVLADNGGYDLYNLGVEPFRAPGNWWGEGTPRVFDNSGLGRVNYAPVLTARPQPLGEK